mmetsp:Transcript_14992/g.47256  ORF Transcript_14992/g.47256 Transcript_14992/m.47256 type:complete len:265 (-) Transcript_14992:1-795(-)
MYFVSDTFLPLLVLAVLLLLLVRHVRHELLLLLLLLLPPDLLVLVQGHEAAAEAPLPPRQMFLFVPLLFFGDRGLDALFLFRLGGRHVELLDHLELLHALLLLLLEALLPSQFIDRELRRYGLVDRVHELLSNKLARHVRRRLLHGRIEQVRHGHVLEHLVARFLDKIDHVFIVRRRVQQIVIIHGTQQIIPQEQEILFGQGLDLLPQVARDLHRLFPLLLLLWLFLLFHRVGIDRDHYPSPKLRLARSFTGRHATSPVGQDEA